MFSVIQTKKWGEIEMLSYQLKLNRFLGKAHKKHGDKYDYSKVLYVNPKSNVIIICPIQSDQGPRAMGWEP